MPRLFVAIDPPPEIKQTLARLRTGLPQARWVDPRNFHLTVRFIGEVDEGAANIIATALMHVEARRFPLTLGGAGHFGRHTLWIGVVPCPPLTCLQGKIESALQGAGLSPDARRYFPHIKLARLRARPGQELRAFLNSNALFRAGPFDVEHFTLMESRLARSGATYEHRADYALR